MVKLLALAAAASLAACASHVAPPSYAHAPAGDGRGWAYEVMADDGGRELGVLATFPAGTAPTLSVIEETARFVSEIGRAHV